jgi:hypothetical protein
MSLTWVAIGALYGAIGGARSGSIVELVSGMISGMVVLPIAGAFLGLIGAEVGGSLVGAVGGLLGSWLALPFSGIAVDAPTMRFMVLFGALGGATCLLFLHIELWIYRKVLLTAWRCVGCTSAFDRIWARSPRGESLHHPRVFSAHLGVPSSRVRS